MVLVTLNVDHSILVKSNCSSHWAVVPSSLLVLPLVLLMHKLGEVEDFLLHDRNGIHMIQAAQVNVLLSIIALVDLVEDLPGNFELNLLPHNLHLVLVLSLVQNYVVLVELLVHSMLCFLHQVVEHIVVLVADSLISLLLLLECLPSTWTAVDSSLVRHLVSSIMSPLLHRLHIRILVDGGLVPLERLDLREGHLSDGDDPLLLLRLQIGLHLAGLWDGACATEVEGRPRRLAHHVVDVVESASVSCHEY